MILLCAAGAVRRFFYVDSSLATPIGGAARAVQFPVSMRLEVTLMEDPRDAIYPPQLFITWVWARAHGSG